MNRLTPIFRPLFVAALCAGTTSALALTTEAIHLTQAAPATLRLRIDTPEPLAGRVQVVRLSNGQTLFTENYRAAEYGHRFDFSHVPSGRYLVWLQTGGNVHRCLVRVQTRRQGSVIRLDKLTSRAMPASVVVHNVPASPRVAGL